MKKSRTKAPTAGKAHSKPNRVAQVKAIGLTISVIAAGVAVGLLQKSRRARQSEAAETTDTLGRIDLSTSFLEQVAGDDAGNTV